MTVWELTVGVGWGNMGGEGQRGENWDICNRVTMKMTYLKKEEMAAL